MNESSKKKSFRTVSCDNFPMKSDIVDIRQEMTIFKKNIGEESHPHSSFIPDSRMNSIHFAKSDLVNVEYYNSPEQGQKNMEFPNLVLPTLKRAIKKLIKNTKYRPLEDLKTKHYAIINDKSAFISSELNIDRRFPIHLKIFTPTNPLIMMIKLLVFLTLVTLFFYVPLQAGFSDCFPYEFNMFINNISCLILLIETVCKLNIGYFSDGNLIQNRVKIVTKYIKKDFLVDLLGIWAVVSEFLFQENQDNKSLLLFKLIKFFIFVKYVHFKRLYNELMQYYRLDTYLKNSKELLELLFLSLFLAHSIACLWYFFALISIEFGEDKSWILTMKISHESLTQHYIQSLYWAVVVMMTVGFGDIIPGNIIEMGYCIVAIFTGCALYAYNINKIGIILQRIYHEETEFKDQMRIITNFMEKKKIDNELQTRIKEYLKFIWLEKKTEHNDKEMEMIGSLSESLKEELLLESYGGIIKAFPMFYKHFSEKTLKNMIGCVKEIHFVPGDFIFFEKELDDCCLFYINRGTVSLTIEGSKKLSESDRNRSVLEKLQEIKEGQVFGEFSFFTGFPRIYSAISNDFISILAIKREDFLKIIQKNSLDYQQFCAIKDSLIFNNPLLSGEFLQKCKSCGSNNHVTLFCPLVQYIPDREKIIKRHEFSQNQQRQSGIKRKYKKSKNSRCWYRLCVKSACKMQKELKKSTTLFNFSQLKAHIKADSPLDSNLFDSRRSLSSIDDIADNGTLSSSSVEKEESPINIAEENSLKEIAIKENIQKIFQSIMEEDLPECIRDAKKSNTIPAQDYFEGDTKSILESRKSKRTAEKKTTNSKKNLTANIQNENESRSPSSRLFKKTNSVSTGGKNPTSAIISSLKIGSSSNLGKKPVISGPDVLVFGFEKGHNFDRYFPFQNLDHILKVYDKKRKKMAFLKRFHPSRLSLMDENKNDTKEARFQMKNYSKYSFFKNYKPISPKTLKHLESNEKKKMLVKSVAREGSSPFFKRKEFHKTSMPFRMLVHEIMKPEMKILSKRRKSDKT